MILEIKDQRVRLDPPVLLDQPDQLDLQELTQKYLDPLGHKEQQDHKDLRVIKVTLETKDHKVYKAPLELMVLLDQPDQLDLQELTQKYLDPLGHKEQQDHKDLRVIKEILETKDLKGLLVEMVRKE